jgi:polyhydroxyalkanoate synthase
MPASADQWLENATRREGSWWPEWQQWLARGQDRVPARMPGDGRLKAIEPAPGSYVRMA